MRGAALIILAWNQWTLTRRCLDSLLAQDLDEAEVIVVDNGSEDETQDGLNAYADRIQIVRLPANLGFVRGMNAGIAAARPDDDVVLLNNDLVFNQSDWLNRLRDAAYAAADHGIVGCRMLGPEPGRLLFHLGGFIEPEQLWGQQTESGQQETDVGQFPRTRRVQAVAFALAYIRRDCLDRIGGLDEIFHSYFEDTDYCLRAADAGIASVVAGAVTLRHDQHGSTKDDGGFRERLWKDSRACFAQRWQQRLIDRYRGNVLWQGLTRLPHAYGELTHGLLWRLDARALRMAFSSVSPELLEGNDFRLELAARRKLHSFPDVALVCAPGQLQTPARGRYRVAIAFSEWQRPPPAWADYYNKFDLLLVPDAFQAEAFREIGIKTPMEILPLGVDREYCHPYVPAQRHPGGHFVFLSVAESLDRDAPKLIVEAFRRSFRADEAAELVIYIRPGNDESAIREVLEIELAKTDGARVSLVFGWGFPGYERAQLLAAADAYVSARRGADWDPIVRGAIACGRVVIAPAYGSQQTLIEEWGLPVCGPSPIGMLSPGVCVMPSTGAMNSPPLPWRAQQPTQQQTISISRPINWPGCWSADRPCAHQHRAYARTNHAISIDQPVGRSSCLACTARARRVLADCWPGSAPGPEQRNCFCAARTTHAAILNTARSTWRACAACRRPVATGRRLSIKSQPRQSMRSAARLQRYSKPWSRGARGSSRNRGCACSSANCCRC